MCIFCLAVLLAVSCNEWDNDIVMNDPEPVNTNTGSAVDADGQLYNMNFDLWSKDGNNEVCYGADASPEQKKVWGSANASTSMLGKNTCIPDSVFVAMEGAGKKAVMLKTQLVNALITKKLAAGCIFTGQMGSINISKLSATLKWGIPFTLRPKALEGYACYKPVAIDVVKAPFDDWLGKTDSAHVFVLLTDWDEQFTVDPATDTFVDIDNDPHIIGYGKVGYNHTMAGYEKFRIDIDYRSNRTPRYVVIVASSSALGDFFTGGDGSTLYLDEFRFIY